MSDQPFQKCACQNCGGSIEFPPQGIGLNVDCPHCNQRTLLTGTTAPDHPPEAVEEPAAPQPAPVPEEQIQIESTTRSKPLVLVGALVVLGLLAGGAIWYFKAGTGTSHPESASGVQPRESPTPAPTGVSADPAPPTPKAVATAKSEKTLDDLKPGPVTLEKAKSGNLIYAVGKLKNDSSHQRFGVKIEIECTDAKGRPAGKASDYTQVIEPNQEWRFRALVLDSKAAAGKVVEIQEDN